MLDSNDLDDYVAMSGVCSVWRNAIAPPIEGGKQGDLEILCARPHQWIVLQEEIIKFDDGGVDRLAADLSTDRMVKCCFSLFGSSDRLLIFVEDNEPYLVKLCGLFTGYLVQFPIGVINEHYSHFAV